MKNSSVPSPSPIAEGCLHIGAPLTAALLVLALNDFSVGDALNSDARWQAGAEAERETYDILQQTHQKTLRIISDEVKGCAENRIKSVISNGGKCNLTCQSGFRQICRREINAALKSGQFRMDHARVKK